MSFYFRTVFPVLLLVLSAAGALAQEPARLSLTEAIDFAYDQSTEVKNARIALLDAEQQIIERRSTGLPQLKGDVSFQRYLQVPKQPLPDQFIDFLEQLNPGSEVQREAAFFLKNNFTAALNLDVMVFDASYFVGLQAARAFREYTAQELNVVKRQVRSSVTTAFLPVLLLDENLEILRRNIANLEKLLYETEELFREGFAEQLDVDRQQLSLNNLRVELENLEQQRGTAVARLKYTIGFPVDQPLELSGDIEELAGGAELIDLSAQANPETRPEYQLALQGETLNELNVRLNRSAYLPSLNAFGTYQHQYQGNTFRDGFWAPATLVGVRLSVPIFDGLNKQAKIERARLDLQKTQNQKIDLVRGIRLEVETARDRLVNARRSVDNQRRNLDLAERIYETTQIKYREGVGSSLELTQAEQSLYAAQSNYIQALYDLVVARQDLQLALGQ